VLGTARASEFYMQPANVLYFERKFRAAGRYNSPTLT
jgi:hypothetical protein